MTVRLICGDALEQLRLLPENSVDAIVTDPPYGLSFMGKDWDHGVPGEVFWREALRVAKPGAHLLAFGGTRTFHRLACAIEDAGWEMWDSIGMPHESGDWGDCPWLLAWVYGSGFPKSLDVSKAIDKRGGAQVAWFGPWFRQWRKEKALTQKEVAALFPSKSGGLTGCVANWELGFNMPTPEQFNLIRDTFGLPFGTIQEAEREVIAQQTQGKLAVAPGQGADRGAVVLDITAPSTDAARQWQGWGTGLKPAWEPIILARKPLEGTVAENVQKWGTGALNIDGCRVRLDPDDPNHRPNPSPSNRGANSMFGSGGHDGDTLNASGRWPANLIHDGSDEVVGMFPQTSAGVAVKRNLDGRTYNAHQEWGLKARAGEDIGYPDTGSSARFFYCAKASGRDRNDGCYGIPASRRAGLVGADKEGELDPLSGRWRTRPAHNVHPIVKPIDLMRYLCRLVTPPGGTVLDPFMGSGSTGKAALLEGFNFIGIDIEPEYVEIARRRIEAIAPLFAQVQMGTRT